MAAARSPLPLFSHGVLCRNPPSAANRRRTVPSLPIRCCGAPFAGDRPLPRRRHRA
ncbi:hypothetical protein BU14_2091s0002 [Porphyra umbilicalis]|uniref:Uncharacterized protein n=1 Tax=Porphyra umbilicalis TaxID=2786 RepID=A0A1X6NJW9_PORUM|nr:hypothetical protein BU14_2091s0002 [Porphyra umbilicalis]|eukprot:OSX68919.1 hypothetical protein BU14_2091s0002 [Porphyra umbilicalis]